MAIADFMARANYHYYGESDPLGTLGDFITAPEISQMFGEIIGIWIADLWVRTDKVPFHYVELGPGRGTLAADALATLANFGCHPAVHLVETSRLLRTAQLERAAQALHHDDTTSLPDDAPLIIIANEFFDALPVHHYVAVDSGWRERLLNEQDGRLSPVAGTASMECAVPLAVRQNNKLSADYPGTTKPGTIYETCPVAHALIADTAERIVQQGGAMLVIDYGYSGPAVGDTLQALQHHKPVDPFAEPGKADLTAHVDFSALAESAQAKGAHVTKLGEQGQWLRRLGITDRLARLSRANPERAAELQAQHDRLVTPQAMGKLFKVLALHAPTWPVPAGFGA